MPKDAVQQEEDGAGLRGLLTLALRYGIGTGLILFLITFALAAVRQCRGEFVYGLDDAYIHMALARHLAADGVWGLSDGFASAVSSILWPLAIAFVYAIKGPDIYTPLIFEFLGVFALMAFVHHVVRRDFPGLDRRHWPAGAAILAITLAAPLHPLVLGGLEHIWHIVGLLWALDRAAIVIAGTADPARGHADARMLVLSAPLLSIVRFETLALVPLIALLLLLRRRFWTALGMTTTALAPVLALGLTSLSQGGYFWPNSLVLKTIRYAPGSPPWDKLLSVVQRVSDVLGQNPAFGALFPLLLFTFATTLVWTHQPFSRPAILLLCAFGQAAAHTLFGAFGWLYRYEAYVMAIGVYAVLYAVAWLSTHRQEGELPSGPFGRLRWGRKAPVAVFVILSLPFSLFVTDRALIATSKAPLATRNILEQQVLVSRFLEQYYDRGSVAMNDIGAVSYFTEVRLLDLFGLGSNAVAQAKVEGRFGPELIEAEAKRRHLDLAVVYDKWFDEFGGLPNSWTRVAAWQIDENIICGSDTVVFYAIDEERAAVLDTNLRNFLASLPKTVAYRFREPSSTKP